MKLSRRSFLKGMAAIAGATAAGIYLPSDKAIAALIEPEPERRFFQAAVAPEPVETPIGFIGYSTNVTYYDLAGDKVHWVVNPDGVHPFREGGAQYESLYADDIMIDREVMRVTAWDSKNQIATVQRGRA